MSVERLLLAEWEEDGFVGRTRVPVEARTWTSWQSTSTPGACASASQRSGKGHSASTWSMTGARTELERPGTDFEWWLTDEWSRWLKTLPHAWDEAGQPAVPWLPPVTNVRSIEVTFCCNLHSFTSRAEVVDDSLRRAAERHLRKTPFTYRAARARVGREWQGAFNDGRRDRANRRSVAGSRGMGTDGDSATRSRTCSARSTAMSPTSSGCRRTSAVRQRAAERRRSTMRCVSKPSLACLRHSA